MTDLGAGTKDYRDAAGSLDGSAGHAQAGDALVLVYATFPAIETLTALARQLVAERQVACVNILPAMTAIYAWQGAIHEDAEVVGLFKTRASKAADVIAAIEAAHPYETPAVFVVPAATVSAPYAAWMLAQTTPGTQPMTTHETTHKTAPT